MSIWVAMVILTLAALWRLQLDRPWIASATTGPDCFAARPGATRRTASWSNEARVAVRGVIERGRRSSVHYSAGGWNPNQAWLGSLSRPLRDDVGQRVDDPEHDRANPDSR